MTQLADRIRAYVEQDVPDALIVDLLGVSLESVQDYRQQARRRHLSRKDVVALITKIIDSLDTFENIATEFRVSRDVVKCWAQELVLQGYTVPLRLRPKKPWNYDHKKKANE